MYFVTICTHLREYLFGDIKDEQMTRSEIGDIAHSALQQLPAYWQGDVDVDRFVVMPNHIHAIIVLAGARDIALGKVVNTYKGGVTRQARQTLAQPHLSVWQSRYHDHIIRDETSLNTIRAYILHNPATWYQDSLYG